MSRGEAAGTFSTGVSERCAASRAFANCCVTSSWVNFFTVSGVLLDDSSPDGHCTGT